MEQGEQPSRPASLSRDVEKDSPHLTPLDHVVPVEDSSETPSGFVPKMKHYLRAFERTMAYYNLEARGIQRVMPAERHSLRNLGYTQIGVLWFSINLAANNITLGMLGPVVYTLSFLDCALCAVFGILAGCLPVAYIATFGPRSGHRSMVIARYTMGWWPAKIVVVLNLIVLLGYCLIDAVVAGQILSAVSTDGSLSVIVGIVIVAVITWAITVFGYSVFHWYERYSWLPQIVVLCILAGVSGPKFDMSTPTSGDRLTVIGNRLSFFSICFSAAITYAGGAADFFVYYPEESPRWKVFSVTMIGLALSFTFALVIGIGLGSGVATNAAWSDAYQVSQGALIVAGFEPLGTFGSFCGVIVAFGLVANMVAPTYVSGMDFQVLGRWFTLVPRFVWNTVGVVIYTVCAIAGRQSLAEIFTNFLALMGYWVSIWIAITLEEHLIFRTRRGLGWNWDSWNDQKKIPIGVAALIAFLVGWAGAILCMAQVWYIGPLAKQIGEYGGDMGNYVGFAWAALVFPPLRWLELKKFGR
ncbi:hypothetical protein MBLNU459_g4309t2 [Dothideomycetes sp. NU459]